MPDMKQIKELILECMSSKKKETHIEKRESFTVFLKERTNILEMKHMLCKILTEEVDSQSTQQDKNSMEGSGSECNEVEVSSLTRNLELPTFDGSIEGESDSKGSNFECDIDPLQFLKSENRSKEGSVIKNHKLCGGEETKNDETILARETKIEKVMMEEEVDPSMKSEKHKENRVKNVDCKDHFLYNSIPKFIKKEVEVCDVAKPHCFQDSDFHEKIVMMKQKSFIKVVGTSMVLESWNANFVGSMDDSSTMYPRQKGCTKAVMMIQVIWGPPSSPPPPKPPDLSLHKEASGFTVDSPWRDTKEAHPVNVNDSVLKDEKEEGEVIRQSGSC